MGEFGFGPGPGRGRRRDRREQAARRLGGQGAVAVGFAAAPSGAAARSAEPFGAPVRGGPGARGGTPKAVPRRPQRPRGGGVFGGPVPALSVAAGPGADQNPRTRGGRWQAETAGTPSRGADDATKLGLGAGVDG